MKKRRWGFLFLFVPVICVAAQSQSWAALQIYQFDPASEITFKADAFLHSFKGSAQKMNGRFELDLKDLDQPGRGAIEVVASRLDTKNKKRDRLMRQEHLETDQYPLIRFVILEAKLEYNDTEQQKADYVLLGELDLHGIKKIIRVIATLDYKQPDNLKIVGQFPVTMTDYGIPIPAFAGVFRVKDTVHISFTLYAAPKS